MQLGLLTAPFPAVPLTEVAGWAAANGYPTLEVACWPRSSGQARRYAGTSHIDADGLTAQVAREIVEDLRQRGASIAALGYYPNPLHPDPRHRAAVVEHLGKVIDAAPKLGVSVVNTFLGADSSKSQRENWQEAKRVWPDIVKRAADNGVRVAIENCPMIFSRDEWPSGDNLAYSPSIWRTMLEELGETVGLNFDPSHLVWQMIDLDAAVREFGERFYFVQAKDVEIDRKGLFEHGVMSAGVGWQVPRLPGLGEVDWRTLFRGLYRVGYDGAVCVEHEDRGFEGSDELVKRGFLLARNFLAPWIV
jgi:sugar phosphate isomerase/epimerase